ncbi:MAG: alginate O-acetyltransferase AlgX-related protein [Janthinobacterium lividum]
MADSRFSSPPTLLRRWLLYTLLGLWLLPAMQTALYMKILRPTRPAFEVKLPRPAISGAAWWGGTLQPAWEAYATQKLGLREWLVEPYNQLRYSVFQQSTNSQVLRGQHEVLFEAGPVQAALGRVAPATPAQMAEQVQRLRAVQDTLARRGKLLVYVIAPSKPELYPENLPDSCQRLPHQPTAYQRYAGPMRAAGIHVLDLAAVFRTWKARSPYPLFPSGGTHWSGYGLVRAADTLGRYLEAHGHFRLPRVRQTGLEISATPRYTDDDLVRMLNLLHNPAPTPPLAYPTLAFDPPQRGERQPRLLLVADSFGWSFIEFYPYLQHLFAPGSAYWYYNHEVAWTNGPATGPALVQDRDLRAELAAPEVIVLLFNAANMGEFDHGFSERARQLFAAGK